MKTYPTVCGAPTGIRNRNGGMSKAEPLRIGPVWVLPSGSWPLGTRVGAVWVCFPLGAVDAVLATLLEVAPEEEPVVEARLVGTRGGLALGAAAESPTLERLSSSLHSARNRSKEGSRVPP